MSLELFDNLLNNIKENKVVQNFIKELSNHLEKENSRESNLSGLKQDECLYQVVEISGDGAYLQNVNNNQVYLEKDIPKEILDKVENDTILKYKNGEYVIEEELTQKFFDSLVDITEYKKIQDKFINESNILEFDENTRYKINKKEEDYTILSCENNNEITIKVPNELIPFFANDETILYFKNGKFNRSL